MFALSPRPFWGWRRLLLRGFGARIGANVHIHPSVRIAIPWMLSIGEDSAIGDRAILYSLGPISIGTRATISQYAHLCAGDHDYRRADFPLLKPPIAIGDEVWICADAFIGPGVSVGTGAIIGARAVVNCDVPERLIVAGNPARPLRQRPKTRT
ncbi:acyl transferase [Stappia sp. 22II-S9-Z10]|nr:acyl transferase [Stappia sp. 22II-S9-Z10]